jgi:ABC-type polysaccharide/polyol phosphate export permease
MAGISTRSDTVEDLHRTVRMLPVALHFAWGDIRARYRRSFLGPLWLVLGTAIGVLGLGYLWAGIFGLDYREYVPSLAAGLVTWQLLSGTIAESPSMLMYNAPIIRNLRTPVAFFPLQLLLRHLLTFAHNALVVLAVLLVYPPDWSATQLLSIVGVALVAANLWWISLLLSMLGARFRDIDPLIAAAMPLLFFLTPVVFRPDHVPVRHNIVWLNPLTYFITVIRDPLLGEVPPLFVYVVVLTVLGVGCAMAYWLLTRRAFRVPFWI